MITKLAKTIKQTRKQRKFSQKDVARWAGMAQGELSKFENEQLDVRMSTLTHLAEALDLRLVMVPKQHLADIGRLINPQPEKELRLDSPPSLLDIYGDDDDES